MTAIKLSPKSRVSEAEGARKAKLLPLPQRFALHPLKPQVLSVRTIAQVDPALAAQLGLPHGGLYRLHLGRCAVCGAG